ncbi:pathogenesis related protein [plant metagenome]|uniref:Pathogenesis related protein n=1 Tax=plant metagenome TaxID=1297885 RepID=A0A484S4H1_9ZZZZ
MQLKNIAVKNFRLLRDAGLILEKQTTVIVGRNNSGKTSLTEVMKRLLVDSSPSFRLEDFSFAAHQSFWNAFVAAAQGADDPDVRKALPTIKIQLTFGYESGEALGTLNEFVIDLNPACTEALVVARYALRDGKVAELFADLTAPDATADPEQIELTKAALFKALRDRVPALFGISFAAVDPNDATNEKIVEASAMRALCASGFISAQRGLDDVSQKDRVVIGKVLENLFATAKTNVDDAEGHGTAEELEQAVKDIQDKIGADFNLKLDALLPALSLFGYPSLSDQELRTETTLDVARLLTNHTKVRYTGANGVHLPEAYNGLGTRNIILILLQLREFFKLYAAMEPRPGMHVVFIEEPEVHLHPQMQEVFIRKLGEIAAVFSNELGTPWPVQFVVSTHSSHVANEAHFETIRYFLAAPDAADGMMKTVVKDLRKGLSGKGEPDRTFLHQYMTLTRCDLFFADKAVLIEGTTERLLLPRVIKMLDDGKPEAQKLGSQYLSVIEVGGAYAHIFFDLLAFLELRTLVITDIDTVKANGKGQYESCQVSHGERTSNACIKAWFKNDVTPAELLAADAGAKTVAKRRIAFQQPEASGGPCGRSFEDAFMLANPALFPFAGPGNEERETQAWEETKRVKKSGFALTYALAPGAWQIPCYITEGLAWLTENNLPPAVATPTATGTLP